MRALVLNIFLGFVWIGLTGEFTQTNLVIGIALGYFLMLMFRRPFLGTTSYFRKVWQATDFIVFFAWSLLISNLRVAREVLTPAPNMRPGIIAVPLDLKSDLEITVLANLITLTPGTLSLDVSTDKKTLYVHSMYVDDPDTFRESIKQGFEKRVRELFE